MVTFLVNSKNYILTVALLQPDQHGLQLDVIHKDALKVIRFSMRMTLRRNWLYSRLVIGDEAKGF